MAKRKVSAKQKKAQSQGCAVLIVGAVILGVIGALNGDDDESGSAAGPTRVAIVATETPPPAPPRAQGGENTEDTLLGVAQEAAELLIHGQDARVEITNVPAVVVSYPMPYDFDGYNVIAAQAEMAHLACVLRETGQFVDYRYLFTAEIDVTDAAGNKDTIQGLTVRLHPEDIAIINCENWAGVNLAALANYYELDPLLANN